MTISTKKTLAGCLLLFFFCGTVHGLILDNRQIDSLASNAETHIINFANSSFECGVYYKYTANGLKNSQNAPEETIQFVSHNAEMLLQTADKLYQSAGISTKSKYDELMRQAKTMLRQQEKDGLKTSDIIYAFGEKCRLFLSNYPLHIKAVSGFIELNQNSSK